MLSSKGNQYWPSRHHVRTPSHAFDATRQARLSKGKEKAAYGGHEAVADLGNQIFITMRKGNTWPPAACDVRIRYDQTIGDLKAAVSAQMDIPVAQQQLFWHKKELTAAYDDKTLLDMNMHTGFALKGYDLSEEPCYWPEVEQTAEGLREKDS